MANSITPRSGSWLPDLCTLPTVERPLREQQFDDLFSDGAVSVHRVDHGTTRIALRAQPGIAARAAELAVRETGCCSFFTFTLTTASGDLWLDVSVPVAYQAVLDTLTDRAGRAADRGSS